MWIAPEPLLDRHAARHEHAGADGPPAGNPHAPPPAGKAIICPRGSAAAGPMLPGPPKTARAGAARSSERSRAGCPGPAAATTGYPSRAPSSPARTPDRSGSRTHRSDTVAARRSARRSAANGRCHAAALSLRPADVPQGFLDHPDLVGIAPVPTTRRILGGQDLDPGCDRKVDHNVGLIIASNAPSDGPHRRDTTEHPCEGTIRPPPPLRVFEAPAQYDRRLSHDIPRRFPASTAIRGRPGQVRSDIH
jgi:hypothetical protein